MDGLTTNQLYHLILADIAMAAAIRVYDAAYVLTPGPDYQPGSLRDRWLADTTDPALRRRVTAMASAGVASLQSLEGARLTEMAERYGVPMTEDLATAVAQHFSDRANRVLTYRH